MIREQTPSQRWSHMNGKTMEVQAEEREASHTVKQLPLTIPPWESVTVLIFTLVPFPALLFTHCAILIKLLNLSEFQGLAKTLTWNVGRIKQSYVCKKYFINFDKAYKHKRFSNIYFFKNGNDRRQFLLCMKTCSQSVMRFTMFSLLTGFWV